MLRFLNTGVVFKATIPALVAPASVPVFFTRPSGTPDWLRRRGLAEHPDECGTVFAPTSTKGDGGDLPANESDLCIAEETSGYTLSTACPFKPEDDEHIPHLDKKVLTNYPYFWYVTFNS